MIQEKWMLKCYIDIKICLSTTYVITKIHIQRNNYLILVNNIYNSWCFIFCFCFQNDVKWHQTCTKRFCQKYKLFLCIFLFRRNFQLEHVFLNVTLLLTMVGNITVLLLSIASCLQLQLTNFYSYYLSYVSYCLLFYIVRKLTKQLQTMSKAQSPWLKSPAQRWKLKCTFQNHHTSRCANIYF